MALAHKGYYGMSTPDATIIASLKPEIKGYFIRNVLWSALQPTDVTYNWTVLENLVAICVTAEIDYVITVRVGDAPPDWLYTNKGVPRVNTLGGLPNFPSQFPYYLNANYKLYFKQ